MMASPAKSNASQERCAASAWPAPQASSITGGRILEHRGFFDSFDLVQQLLGQDLTDAFAASVRNAMRG